MRTSAQPPYGRTVAVPDYNREIERATMRRCDSGAEVKSNAQLNDIGGERRKTCCLLAKAIVIQSVAELVG